MKITQKDLAELTRTCKDPQAALKAVKILNGTLDPESIEAVATWVRRCFHRPRKSELKMAALDAVLDGFGVEAITDENTGELLATYVNQGDTYTTTIVRNARTGEYLLTSWGDFLEAHEREAAEEREECEA